MSMETTSTSQSLGPEAVGAAIFTADGNQFGYVKEVRGGYFKVDAPWARDYWLSCTYIARHEGNQVWLNVTKDEADEHRLEAPGLDPSSDPHAATTQDAILSDGQALAQRERMERELAEQRERLQRGG